MKRITFLLVAVLCTVTLGLRAAGQVYTVTDLGSFTPAAINTWGQVVGTYNNHAYMWTWRGGLKDLGLLPGGTFSGAAAINDLGVVAGTADGAATVRFLDANLECDNLTQPFLWTLRNGMQGLGTALPVNFDYGGFWTVFACVDPFFALGNNIRGQVVGYNGELATFQWAFSWTPAQGMTYAFGGDPATSANAVSNTGQIVGQYGYYSLPWPGHAITVNKGVTTDLGTLSAEPDPYFIFSSSANGVNDLGQIVGWSDVPDLVPFFHAVLWAPTEEIRDLGTLPGDTLSDALKINFFGKVIGISGNTEVPTLYDASGDLALSKGVSGRPFIWSDRNGMQDLNTLIPTDSGWTLNSVADINVWGQIVGTGTLNGQPHGFLLTPKSFF